MASSASATQQTGTSPSGCLEERDNDSSYYSKPIRKQNHGHNLCCRNSAAAPLFNINNKNTMNVFFSQGENK